MNAPHATRIAELHRDASALPTVLYIGGWGRSGSTLADLLVGQLDGFVSVGEVRELFLRGVLEDRRCGCGEPFSVCPFWSEVGAVAFGGWNRDFAQQLWLDLRRIDRGWTTPLLLSPWAPPKFRAATERVTPALRALYGAIRKVARADVIVDSSKLPNYALLLRQSGIDVRVAHLVRDPRGVMYSWQKQQARGDIAGEVPATNAVPAADEMLRYSVPSGSLRYVLYNGLTQALRGCALPYRRDRYEDLVARPVETLSGLAAFAGRAATPEELGWVELQPIEVNVVHTVDGNPMRLGHRSITLRLDDDWRTQLPVRDRRVVSALTAPLRLVYGYRGVQRRYQP